MQLFLCTFSYVHQIYYEGKLILKKYVFIPLTIALAIMVTGIIFLNITLNKNPLHVYLIPENFVGEIEVTFDQADYPPLPKEGNSYIYNIPESGKLKTSSAMKSGTDEVYYVDNQGQRKKVSHEQFHGVSTHGGDRDTTATFFIGTKEQYENYVKQQ
jgi:hypothetical protein